VNDLLQRWAQAIHEGRAPNPRTRTGFLVYFAIGFGIGWLLSNLGSYG
jgi:hypothetical protein